MLLLSVAIAYLLGSIPFGLLIGLMSGRDVRQLGSGNIGFANVLRTIGWRAGLPCFICDVMKGFAPAFWIAPALCPDDPSHLPQVLAGIAAICGHNFPVWLRFKGGKGVATSAGALLAILPGPLLVAFSAWFLVVLTTRYMSLGSLVAGVVLLSAHLAQVGGGLFLPDALPITITVFVLVTLVFIQHRSNIRRLIHGTEPRIFVATDQAEVSAVVNRSDCRRVTILGAGGWGTAMGNLLASNNLTVTLWGHCPDHLHALATDGENKMFLPGIKIDPAIQYQADMKIALKNADIVIVAIPTQFLRASLAAAKGLIPANVPIISLTKGIEHETLKRPSEVIADVTGCTRIVALSGPSHAEEVAKKRPTTVVIASEDEGLVNEVQAALMSPYFRVYTANDIVGVELGGALKNVIAVAAGIGIGLELGDNAMAALVTRGQAEMTRLGMALGANPMTFAGLSGIGDLIVTCISPFGRNRQVGLELGRGKTPSEILAGMSKVAEGVTTAVSARALGQKTGVELPIVEEVYRVLYEDKDPRKAVEDLMTREATSE